MFHSRKSQADLEQENYEQRLILDDERRKARETTDRAKEMIKVFLHLKVDKSFLLFLYLTNIFVSSSKRFYN